MIKYNPDQWFTLIFHRYSRKTFKKTLPNMISIIIYSTVFTFIYELYFKASFEVSPVVHSLLGFVLGLFLVFRTNTAYDKWWEGRKLWGSLVNDNRNLTLKFNAFLRPELKDVRNSIAEFLSSYVVVMKDHLRDKAQLESTILTEEDKKEGSNWNHKPNFIASKLYKLTNKLYKEQEITG